MPGFFISQGRAPSELVDLAEKLDRDPTTTRNYLKKLMEQGTVTEFGDDPSHDGRGRAPKLYGPT